EASVPTANFTAVLAAMHGGAAETVELARRFVRQSDESCTNEPLCTKPAPSLSLGNRMCCGWRSSRRATRGCMRGRGLRLPVSHTVPRHTVVERRRAISQREALGGPPKG